MSNIFINVYNRLLKKEENEENIKNEKEDEIKKNELEYINNYEFWDAEKRREQGVTRYVCISDTHSLHNTMKWELPPADVIIHAGDFTNVGKFNEVIDFFDWYNNKKGISKKSQINVIADKLSNSFNSSMENIAKTLSNDNESSNNNNNDDDDDDDDNNNNNNNNNNEKSNEDDEYLYTDYSYKIAIAGNHDISLHDEYYLDRGADRFHNKHRIDLNELKEEMNQRIILNDDNDYNNKTIYLNDTSFQLPDEYGNSIIWGSPWTPEFCDWAFNARRGDELKEIWSKIDLNTDILITHGPPYGILDKTANNMHTGCVDLKELIDKTLRPRVHIFGHIHEAYGADYINNILYINASTCSFNYNANNKPIVFDLPHDPSLPARLITNEL